MGGFGAAWNTVIGGCNRARRSVVSWLVRREERKVLKQAGVGKETKLLLLDEWMPAIADHIQERSKETENLLPWRV